MTCPRCSAPAPENSRYCPSCGAALDPSSLSPTRSMLPGAEGSPGEIRTSPRTGPVSRRGGGASGGSYPDERFAPGRILAGRYRIVGPAGRGGMGEVYRADDLKLAQPVALKFLPEHLARDEDRLSRLLGEVRIARQVSHPNVCRVYDAAEAEGLHFLSMEYVDGEDLATLLRRIGRLSPDKGMEIARQICAGLAAAHDRGVIHRDLKPANVMIDGRGKVRLTDFGLAGLAEDGGGARGRGGTPAYMAPEQLAGEEATIRSDLYSLGLVLYELFTGKAAFKPAASLADLRKMREASEMASPSTLVTDLDPAVERIIQRCLEPDPRARPVSALAVSAALPGGDPLAAALAAGETPSPEMVAAAGEEGTLSPVAGISALAGLLLGLVLLAAASDRQQLFRRVPFNLSPEVLTDRAENVVRAAGYPEAPADAAWGFLEHQSYLQYVRDTDSSPDRWETLSGSRVAGIIFWYRQSPRPLVPVDWNGTVTYLDPPTTFSGDTSIDLDTRGRLMLLERVPPQVVPAGSPAPADPDWTALFREAGLQMEGFEPVEPEWVPPFHADRRAAWKEREPELPGKPLRVEAASFRGKPVYFQVIGPWTKPRRMEPLQAGQGLEWTRRIQVVLILLILAAGVLAARQNIKLGRGDRRGSLRISLCAFLTLMFIWVLAADHVPSLVDEYAMFVKAVGLGLFIGGLLWLAYMALEPSIRRHWPAILVGWSRVLTGRWRDPRVGRDILAGALAGVVVSLLSWLLWLVPAWLGRPGPRPASSALNMFLGGASFTAILGAGLLGAVLNSMAGVAFIFVVLFLVRRWWLAAGVIWAVVTGLATLAVGTDLPALHLAIFGVIVALLLALLFRLGMLSLMVAYFFMFQGFPLSLNLTAWYGTSSLMSLLLLAGVGVYGYVISRRRWPAATPGTAPAG